MLSSYSINKPFYEMPEIKNTSYLATLSNKTAPSLWSSASNKEYLRVQVLADAEAPFEKSTDDVLNMNTYTCHICDFEVPKQYFEEHKNGEIHKNLLKIADLALERTRKQITCDAKKLKISIQVAETYFCDHCAVIVQTENKFVHETSESHLKLLKFSKIVRDFLMIYEDKDAIDLIKDEINGFHEMETLIPDLINCTDNISELNEHKIVVDPDLNELKLNNSGIESGAYEGESASDVKSNTQQTNLKEMKLEPGLSKIDLESKEHPITTPQVGSKVQNLKMHFDLESFDERLSQLLGRFETTLAERLAEEQSTQSDHHKSSKEKNAQPTTKQEKNKSDQPKNLKNSKQNETHQNELGQYLKIVTDKCKTVPIHSVEAFSDKIIMITAINGDQIKVPVNNFHSMHGQKNKLFCKICVNPNIGYKHQDCEEHMEKVMLPIEDKNAIRKIDDIWSHCILCNDLTKNLTFHLQSLIHKKKLKQCLVLSGTDINENVIDRQPVTDASQSVQEHGLIASHNNLEISCNICEDTIPNKVTSVIEHVKTFKHITNYNTTIENNMMNEIDDVQYYCVPCDMCVTKRFALGHCNGKKHNKHLADIQKNQSLDECTQVTLPSISQQITRQKASKETDSDLICFVCNVVITSVDKHSNSLEHKKRYLMYLEANKLNEIEQDTFYCIPCNTVILIDYLMTHCTSMKHKTHLKSLIGNASNVKGVDKTSQLIGQNTHISRSIARSVKNAQASTSTPNPPPVSQNGVLDGYTSEIPLPIP